MMDVRRALVDLAKDRNGVVGTDSKHEGGLILDWLLEREFGTRKYADSHRTILRRAESSCAGAEVVCDEFFADFGWARSHAVQTVVAHIKDLLSRKPPPRRRTNHRSVTRNNAGAEPPFDYPSSSIRLMAPDQLRSLIARGSKSFASNVSSSGLCRLLIRIPDCRVLGSNARFKRAHVRRIFFR